MKRLPRFAGLAGLQDRTQSLDILISCGEIEALRPQLMISKALFRALNNTAACKQQ